MSGRKPLDFTRTSHCRTLVHCRACRTDPAWRATAVAAGLSATADWECPSGYTAEILPTAPARAAALDLEKWRQANMPCCGGGKKKKGETTP